MKKLHIDRLKKIVKHLKHGKLGHKEFDFTELHTEFNEIEKRKKENKRFCGSAGCAIGEFPIIFSRHFRFEYSDILLKRKSQDEINLDVGKFLGLDNDDVCHLFFPRQQLNKYGGKLLAYGTTKKQVADNILTFIKYKEKG